MRALTPPDDISYRNKSVFLSRSTVPDGIVPFIHGARVCLLPISRQPSLAHFVNRQDAETTVPLRATVEGTFQG